LLYIAALQAAITQAVKVNVGSKPGLRWYSCDAPITTQNVVSGYRLRAISGNAVRTARISCQGWTAP
jgi:hypothetical protein